MTTIAPVSLLFLALAPGGATDLADRPYGHQMGDGLRLSTEVEPQPGGGICADEGTLFGIDVSYYQGDVDWDAVAADGVEYAFVRVSHSLQFFDPEFDTNLAGSRAAGIHTGVYQYFEPDEDPIAQADLLLESMGPLQPGDLPPVIDVESTAGLPPASVASAVRAWVDHVEAVLGVTPIVYTGYYFWQDNVASVEFGEYPLWIAWYGVDCPSNVPTGWSQWAFHQYCDCGSVAGVAGNVDVNRFNGSLADLEALGAEPEPCGSVGVDGAMLDNGDTCYRLHGNPNYWREEPMGEGDSLVWTNATDNADAANYATWDLFFEEAGLYDVQAHIVQPFGETTAAAYVVSHAGGEDAVFVDQSLAEGWVSLGEFMFDADTPHRILLGDNTGESNDAEVSIVFDALQITRLDGDDGTSGGVDGDESTGDGGGSESTGGPVSGTSGPGSGTSGPAGESSGTDAPALPAEGGGEDGCGCRSSGGDAPWLLLGVFGLVARRRRASLR